MRFYDRPLEPGDEIADGGEPVVAGFGHALEELRDG